MHICPSFSPTFSRGHCHSLSPGLPHSFRLTIFSHRRPFISPPLSWSGDVEIVFRRSERGEGRNDALNPEFTIAGCTCDWTPRPSRSKAILHRASSYRSQRSLICVWQNPSCPVLHFCHSRRLAPLWAERPVRVDFCLHVADMCFAVGLQRLVNKSVMSMT